MDRQLQEVKDQVDVNCRDLATRIGRLETNRRRIRDDESSRNDSRSPRRERGPPYQTTDADAQYIRSVKVDAPSFDGRLDPQVYIDWQLAMDRYFRWHDMSESRKVRLAVMKLTGQAGQYWENLERMMRYRREDPVDTWESMKEKLMMKYVPPSFRQQLLDNGIDGPRGTNQPLITLLNLMNI